MFNDLLYAQGQDNLAGLVGEVYTIAMEDVDTLPALASAASLVTAAADIIPAVGKNWARLYFTDETGKVETKSVGERDGKGRETMLSVRYPAMGIELENAIRKWQNTPSVVCYKLARNGKKYLLGVVQLLISSTALSLDIPAYFESGDATSGEKRPDQNGVVLIWKFTSAHGPIEYAGDIQLTPTTTTVAPTTTT